MSFLYLKVRWFPIVLKNNIQILPVTSKVLKVWPLYITLFFLHPLCWSHLGCHLVHQALWDSLQMSVNDAGDLESPSSVLFCKII